MRMPKWEYCAIRGTRWRSVSGLKPYYPHLTLFAADGLKEWYIEKPEIDNAAKAIAQLGEEGWEMVACGNMDESDIHVLYFKRPKP